MAMAAKAKLLMRELKTVKADFAFAKDRCAQLEEENRMLRESREKGDNPDDDDLVSNPGPVSLSLILKSSSVAILYPIHFVNSFCLFPNILMMELSSSIYIWESYIR